MITEIVSDRSLADIISSGTRCHASGHRGDGTGSARLSSWSHHRHHTLQKLECCTIYTRILLKIISVLPGPGGRTLATERLHVQPCYFWLSRRRHAAQSLEGFSMQHGSTQGKPASGNGDKPHLEPRNERTNGFNGQQTCKVEFADAGSKLASSRAALRHWKGSW